MDENLNKVEELSNNVKDYLNIRIELLTLKLSAKAAVIFSNALSAIIVVLFLFMFLISISITTGLYFSSLTGSYTTGFLILSGIYFLLFIIFFALRKPLVVNPMKEKIIKQLFDEE